MGSKHKIFKFSYIKWILLVLRRAMSKMLDWKKDGHHGWHRERSEGGHRARVWVRALGIEMLSLTTKHQKGIPSEKLRNRFIPNWYLISRFFIRNLPEIISRHFHHSQAFSTWFQVDSAPYYGRKISDVIQMNFQPERKSPQFCKKS
jgi:hypothetical protein